MSLDYPNRADWLAVRATPAKLPTKLVHLSAPLLQIKHPVTGEIRTVVAKGRTLNTGRTQEKFVRGLVKLATRRMRREAKREARLSA